MQAACRQKASSDVKCTLGRQLGQHRRGQAAALALQALLVEVGLQLPCLKALAAQATTSWRQTIACWWACTQGWTEAVMAVRSQLPGAA